MKGFETNCSARINSGEAKPEYQLKSMLDQYDQKSVNKRCCILYQVKAIFLAMFVEPPHNLKFGGWQCKLHCAQECYT